MTAFAPLQNDTFLRACLRQRTEYTPVWLMRQAGRFLPEYRALRARVGSFLDLVSQVELATEVALMPMERFGLDAAILFSDILVIPEAMGLGLSFLAEEGPRLAQPVQDDAAVAGLHVPDLEKLRHVLDTVRATRIALAGKAPLIGFAGSPWTLACYMVEGSGSTDFRTARTMLYRRPDLLNRVLRVNADTVASFLNAQIEAGAQAVMLFDSWGGVLSGAAYEEFDLSPLRRVLSRLHREYDGVRIPRIVFAKGAGNRLQHLSKLDCDVIGLDWTVDLQEARAVLGPTKALQGNLDPLALLAKPAVVEAEASKVLRAFGPVHMGVGEGATHIFNLGHGVHPHTPPEHVAALVDAVHGHSKSLRRAAAR
ncbi:uroporphyrinogen decarboxylase [Candidatus Symbiobacter mobilis]|uniref:Uroporphyrinogen decarboxylase n=1 Tax=Candidatus Symbiobacter mobilis CR TaxID=946483 RepID=U5N9R6_9BURK|nr:uroporphyrinogen decarboxylase [Candidatus Symbiobacter mobilis]AGX86983.1 uroporphyrinogen decarboxylase [Candidatus Symbiobacter mobilis CR]